jgi:hypothetical protein
MSSVPDSFGPEFLDWFRANTEAYWASLPDETPDAIRAKFIKRRVSGCSWRYGTKWLGGLSDEQIGEAEAQWDIRFPPDQRLFLRRPHTVDRPMRCARYLRMAKDSEQERKYLAPAFADPPGHTLAFCAEPSFYDWIDGKQRIKDALERVMIGLLFDVENDVLWPESWGNKPGTVEKREQHVRALVAAAPQLIPIYKHRFLLGEPCEAGNPVFSIMQSDIIVYGTDLHGYFLIEFADELLALSPNDEAIKTAKAHTSDLLRYESTPFWGELLFIKRPLGR